MLNKIIISPVRKKLIVYVVLTVVTLVVFGQVNQYDFVNVEDTLYVTRNNHVQSGISLDGLYWAFSTTYAEFYHPLTWLSLMFDYQFHGLNAGSYHLTNLVFHIMSTLLVFWLFNRMTGTIWRSAFVAAFFALHPLRVESVAWIAERKDVLSAFFWMLTLCFYVYYTEKPILQRYLLVLFSFVLALMSKPMVVTLPVIMILLDFWPLSRFRIGIDSQKNNIILWQLKEKTPFFILSAAFSIATIFIWNDRLWVINAPFIYRLANAPVVFMTYLEKILWPQDLFFFQPFSDLSLWQVLGAASLIFVISFAVIIMANRFQYLFVGWLWYSIAMFPVMGILKSGVSWIHGHYTYLPSIGIGIMLGWGVPRLFLNSNTRKKILFPAEIAILAIITVLTWQQCHYWKNSITLFNYALQVNKNNFLAHNNLGAALFEEGKIEKAVYHFNEATRLKPDFALAYKNRGVVYAKIGHYQSAVEDYTKVISLTPDSPEIYNNRGAAYAMLDLRERAFEDFNKALLLRPDFAEAYNNRGLAYLYQGSKNLGCHDVQKACELGNCSVFKAVKSKGYCH